MKKKRTVTWKISCHFLSIMINQKKSPKKANLIVHCNEYVTSVYTFFSFLKKIKNLHCMYVVSSMALVLDGKNSWYIIDKKTKAIIIFS